jgi:hypothetical protein
MQSIADERREREESVMEEMRDERKLGGCYFWV